MKGLALPLGVLSLLSGLGLEGCKSSASDRTPETSSAGGAGGDTGGASGPDRGGPGAAGMAGAATDSGAGAAGCPSPESGVVDDQAPLVLHPRDMYQLFPLGVLDDLAYFTEGHELRRVPLAGGEVETVGPLVGYPVLLFATDQLVWVQADSDSGALRVFRAPLRDPTDVTLLVEEIPFVTYFLTDQSSIYWITTDPNDVYRAPLSGGEPELLVQDVEPLGAVAHAGYFYWIDLDSDHLERVAVAGGMREELVEVSFGGPMAAADGTVYWGDTILGSIEKWSPQTGRVRLASAFDPIQLQVADDIVYWSQGLLGGAVHSVGVDGQGEQHLLCGIRAEPSIALANEHLLVGGSSGLILLTL